MEPAQSERLLQSSLRPLPVLMTANIKSIRKSIHARKLNISLDARELEVIAGSSATYL